MGLNLPLCPMKAFVINLGSATRRWTAMETAFARTPFEIQRIAAVDGATLQFPLEDYAERRFHWFLGRKTNPGEVGCYLSHVLAMRMFLKTNDSHGLICEDDIVLRPEFSEVVAAALLAPQRWNILRLTGLSTGNPVGLGRLCGDYRLCISLVPCNIYNVG